MLLTAYPLSEMTGSIDNSSVTTTTTNGDVGGNAGGGVPPLASTAGARDLQTKVLHVALTYPTSASDFADARPWNYLLLYSPESG